MTSFAFVFPGQGSQSVGMLDAWGDDPVVAQTLAEASDAMGEDMAKLIHEGPKEALGLTTNTQPVMLVSAVAAYRAWLAEGGAVPSVVAGHSLGEYSALVASGVLTLAQAAPLVRFRAQAMQEAVPVGTGAMAAILGLPTDKVIAGCAEAQATFGEGSAEVVEAVNFNDPGQTVIAGSKAAVEKAKRYIFDGDIMQVVLSQRMSQPFSAPPLSLYRALRSLNPSPYMFYYDMGNHHVVGASPEILVRLEDGTVTARPIAGTRPRGKTREQDLALAEELLADPKERAEHVQLMDLGRNDVGRVAQTGTVKVTDNMMIERYSHVMHIVSNVEGKLKPGMDAIDVLKATFPAGTVSGAPKVRAMEIIDELEPSKRGIYAGAVGYLGFNGDMDVAIAIRTGVIKNDMLYVQAGAGIVADSVPESEWMETQNKARAVLRAAELVNLGLDTSLKGEE